jgi:ribose transport system permease protein
VLANADKTDQASRPVAGKVRSGSRERTIQVALMLVRLGPLVSLVVLCVVMTLASPYFLTKANLVNLGGQTSVVAVLGVGQLMVMLTRGIDLSVGSIVAFSAVAGALVSQHLSWAHGAGTFIVVALAAGLFVGLVNGAAFVYGRMPHPFIVTLATLGIVQGFALLISGGKPVTSLPPFIIELGNGDVLGVPIPVLITAAVGLAGATFLRTQWGRWVYAVGGNPEGAERVGIPTKRVLMSVYLISGACAGLAGVIVAGRTATASPVSGQDLELSAITAVIIGGASFFGGRGSVGNVIIGALIFTVISNGLNLLDVSSYWQYVAAGTVIAIAVEMDVIRSALEERFRVLRSSAASP